MSTTLCHALRRSLVISNKLSSSTLIAPNAAASTVFTRHESTSRRMTKKLRLHPHASFKTLDGSPDETHLIYNPPAAPPTPYNTPRLFLPENDPRLSLPNPLHSTSTPTSTSTSTATKSTSTSQTEKEEGGGGEQIQRKIPKLPPALRPVKQKTYHLTKEQIATIQALRKADPAVNTRKELGRQFGCSQFFIGMVAPTTEDRKQLDRDNRAKVREGWGKARVFARQERKRRRALWGVEE